MSTVFSNSVSRLHVFAHKRTFPPSLPELYCTNSRMTETPNSPTPLYSPNNRGYYSETSTIYPIQQYLGLAVFANPCQSLVYETLAPHHLQYYGYSFFASDFHLPSRCMTRSETSPPASCERRGASYCKRVEGVCFVFTPRPFNYLSQSSPRLTIPPTLLLPLGNGVRKFARVQVALHGMTVVPPYEQGLRYPHQALNTVPKPDSVYVQPRYPLVPGRLYNHGIAARHDRHHSIQDALINSGLPEMNATSPGVGHCAGSATPISKYLI